MAARWVFAGPGSPSYALRQWAGSPVPDALDARLAAGGEGGAVVFASAAALTLGLVTVPVYEIYKVGAEPRWLTGLDVLGRATGLRAAVVPHFDNTEGGTHDTRFCYLGQRRLEVLEAQLPEGAFVLGVDEHTGLVLDLDTGEGRVVGRGAVTVRAEGRSWTAPSGSTVTLDELAEHGRSTLTSTQPQPLPHPQPQPRPPPQGRPPDRWANRSTFPRQDTGKSNSLTCLGQLPRPAHLPLPNSLTLRGQGPRKSNGSAHLPAAGA